MANYGIKTTLEGFDVGTANIQQISFSSQYPLFKVAFSGNLTLNIPQASDPNHHGYGTVTFAHNLGYFPAFQCYGYLDNGSTQRQSCDYISQFGLANTNYVQARIDANNLYIYGIDYNTGGGTITTTIFYYIYVDPIT